MNDDRPNATACLSKKRPSPTGGIASTILSPNSVARIPVGVFLRLAFPDPDLLSETENNVIDDILAGLNKHGLTSHQSQNLLELLGRIIEMGRRMAKGTTH